VVLGLLAVPAAVTAEAPVALPALEVVATPIIEANRVDAFGGVSTVVGEEQVRDLNAQDLPSALRRTPGVTISRYNPVGSFGGAEGGAIFVRGLGSSRPGGEMKTYVDGVPLMMGVFNHPLMDILPVGAAGSIEVVKGAQPHRFGNTFSAVNLVPKRVAEEGHVARLSAQGGSFDTWAQTLDAGVRDGPFDAYLAQGWRRSDGDRDHADGRTSDVYGRLGYQLSPEWSASVVGLYSNNYARDPGVEGLPATRQGRYETRDGLGVLTLAHDYSRLSGEIKLYSNNGNAEWTGQTGLDRDTLIDWSQWGLRARESLRPWEGGLIELGLDSDRVDGEVDFVRQNGTRRHWDGPTFRIDSPLVAVSQTWGLGVGWAVTPSTGVRYYRHNEFENQWAPQAGLVLADERTSVHASYARGVNYPGLDVVVFAEYVIPALGRSWEDLEPETLNHFEVGVSREIAPWLQAGVTLFYDKGRNRYVVVPPPPPPPRYDSIESFRIRGGELTVTATPVEELSLFAGLTLLDTRPSDLPYAPSSSVAVGANWRPLPRLRVSADAEYVSKMQVLSQARRLDAENPSTVDSHFLLNARVAYRLTEPRDGVGSEVFLALENLTDTDYEYRPGYPMPGFGAMVGLVLSL
jgi:iron complex outermembrane receptor protein